MTVQPLRLLGDPVLRTACDPVTRFDDATGRLVDDLMDTVLLPGRAGLAAPQIGVSLAAPITSTTSTATSSTRS